MVKDPKELRTSKAIIFLPSNSSYVKGWKIENTKVTVITHLYMDFLEDGFKHRDSQPRGQGRTQALGEKRRYMSTEGILAQPSRNPKTGLISYIGNHNIQIQQE